MEGAYGGGSFNLITSGTEITVIETGGNDRYTVEKRSGSTGWNEHAYSTESHGTSGGNSVTITFTAQETNTAKMMGLNTDPTSNTSYNTIDYAFYPHSGAGVHIYENGSKVANSIGTYTSATVFAITYAGTNVFYYMDGVLKRTVNTAANRTFHVDSSIYNVNGGFDDIRFYRGQGRDGIPRGNQGNDGPNGDQGFQGFQGNTMSTSGNRGPQGSKGNTGTQGSQGSGGGSGPIGYRGPQGISAANGYSGTLYYSSYTGGSGSGSRTIQNGLIK